VDTDDVFNARVGTIHKRSGQEQSVQAYPWQRKHTMHISSVTTAAGHFVTNPVWLHVTSGCREGVQSPEHLIVSRKYAQHLVVSEILPQ